MAYTWEPRWEPYKVEINGIIIMTCRDRVTGMIACPICINALEKCLGGESIPGYQYENSFFFSDEDLIKHIRDYHGGRAHYRRYQGRRRGGKKGGR